MGEFAQGCKKRYLGEIFIVPRPILNPTSSTVPGFARDMGPKLHIAPGSKMSQPGS